MTEQVTYERLHTPNPGYVLIRNGVRVGVLTKNRVGWCGTATHFRDVEVRGHPDRNSAGAALLEAIDAAPDGAP